MRGGAFRGAALRSSGHPSPTKPLVCHVVYSDPPYRIPARAIAEGFRQVPSKGGYFSRALRDRFEFVRLGGWDESECLDPD
jgi:hypothetical protein